MKTILVLMMFSVLAGAKAEESGLVRFVGLPDAPTVDNAVSEAANKNLTLDWPSPFTNALAWSDGELPHYGPTYLAGQTNGANSVLWTPYVTTMTVFNQFKTLRLETGCTLCLRQKPSRNVGFVFNDLEIDGNPAIWLSDNGGVTLLDGKITLADGANLSIHGRNNRIFALKSELCGNGNMKFQHQSGTSQYSASYELYGLNTNFNGKVIVNSEGKNKSKQYDLSQVSTLIIEDERNLGGKLESFTYDALRLARFSTLSYSGSSELVLPVSLNRGLSIGVFGAQIKVEKDSGMFAVEWPVTVYSHQNYPSVLYKKGAGRLVLGNELRFTSVAEATSDSSSDSKENPVNGHPFNFTIMEGSFGITHCDAVNGAQIAFSNNTEMVLSVDAADADFRRYGVRCTKVPGGSSPFITDVPVRLVASREGGLTELRYSAALFTVNEACKDDVNEKLSVTLDVGNNYKLAGVRFVMNEKKEDADTATITFYADVYHRGLILSVR